MSLTDWFSCWFPCVVSKNFSRVLMNIQTDDRWIYMDRGISIENTFSSSVSVFFLLLRSFALFMPHICYLQLNRHSTNIRLHCKYAYVNERKHGIIFDSRAFDTRNEKHTWSLRWEWVQWRMWKSKTTFNIRTTIVSIYEIICTLAHSEKANDTDFTF